MLVEVCANSLESALNAEKAGADRLEICSELGVGGITPSYGVLKSLKERITIPMHVLIRPRSGDFTYSDFEFEAMKRDIALCVELGFQGIVSGILKADFTLDERRTGELIALSGALKFTFHRAFDWVVDPVKTMTQLEALGVDYILTSGQAKSALIGEPLLATLQSKALTCTIMPGGGINDKNAGIFKQKGFEAIHLSGTTLVTTFSQMPAVPMNSEAYLKENTVAITEVETIQNVVRAVK